MSLSIYGSSTTKACTNKTRTQYLSELKAKLSKIYKEEYEEYFNQILILSEEQFFSVLNKRVNSVITDSFLSSKEEDKQKIFGILKDLEMEKKKIHKKDFNYLESQFNVYYKENITNNNSERAQAEDLIKSQKSKIIKKQPLSQSLNKIEKESSLTNTELDLNKKNLFEFIGKNENKRNFHFRKHCLFNKNHALHDCFEKQLANLNKIKLANSTSEILNNLNLETSNFFLPLTESSYKNYLDRCSVEQTKVCKTSRNAISLTSSYSNFISNARKSNGILIQDKYKNLKKSFLKGLENESSLDKLTKNNKDCNIKQNEKIKFLICLLCKKVYHSNSVLMYCDFCSLPFYSCLQEKPEEHLYPATWEKYHCGAIVNDQMKCPQCKSKLSLNTKLNKLICDKCNSSSDPLKIKWKCLVCNEDFKANAKIYNPLEFKIIKSAIKDAILNKQAALPEEIDCCMEIREKIIKSGLNTCSSAKAQNKKDEKFYLRHKKECAGLLYQGYLYNRKVVVCSECKTFVNYEKFIWFCPFCNKRYRKKNSNFDKCLSNSNNFNNKIKEEKDDFNIELQKKVKSDGLITVSNPNEESLVVMNNHKENDDKQIKFNDLKIEKEKVKVLYKSNNVSKVIEIENKDNDKPILDRLKSKFTNSNFSTNFGSFINKAVSNKRSPLFKEAINKSINLNFSVNDIKELQTNKNPLNFSTINNASDANTDKEKTNSTNKYDINYFNVFNSNSNNDSSNNSTFKNIKNNNKHSNKNSNIVNNKLKIISLKGTKFNNNTNNSDLNIFDNKNKNSIKNHLEKSNKENSIDIIIDNNQANEYLPYREQANCNSNNLYSKKETNKSKFNNENEKLNLYEIIKEGNNQLNDCEYEIKIEKENLNTEKIDLISNDKLKKKENTKQNLMIDLDDSVNDDKRIKYTITPSVKNSKLHFNSFFRKHHYAKNLNNETENNLFNFSINFNENPKDSNADGFIYSRKSLILKKNSNNKNGNYIENLSPIPNIFNKNNVKRIKNRIYLNSMKLDKNLFEINNSQTNRSNIDSDLNSNKEISNKDKVNIDNNISDNLYIPGKQKIQLVKEAYSLPNKSNLNNSNELSKSKKKEEKKQNFPVEILYKDEEAKDINLTSSESIEKLESSVRKNSSEKNNYKSNFAFSNQLNRYGSVNSNNNLNDLSTSSISHNNKFMNCYYSKKSSDNELLSNFNNSSSKMNYYNKNEKNSNISLATEELNDFQRKNILRHQSLVFAKRQKNLSNNDIINVLFNKQKRQKDNLIQNLEDYFCNESSKNPNEINFDNDSTYKNKHNHYPKRSSNSIVGFVYKRNLSMCNKSINNENSNKSNKNFQAKISNNKFTEKITENLLSEYSNSSGIMSSIQNLSNMKSNDNVCIQNESKKIINEFIKKNSLNSNKSLSSANNFNFISLNNKEGGGVINEVIKEDLMELEQSCTKSKLRKSINFNANSNNSNNNNEFQCNSAFKKAEQIEIVFNPDEISDDNKNINNSIKEFSLKEELKRIKIENNGFNREAIGENSNLISSANNYKSNDFNEQIISSNKKSNLKSTQKASLDKLSNYYDSNKEAFDFTNFTYKKENLEFTELTNHSNYDNNNNNKEDSDSKRKSNKKVDFLNTEILLTSQSPSNHVDNNLEINYDLINYKSPLSVKSKKADFNSINSYVKNSIKSSSQISIVNISQNNNYMVDENNINLLIEDFTFNLDDYIMEKSIGEGSYASVFTASSKLNYKKYAIKKIIVDDIGHINGIVPEIKILSKFNHVNIVQIYGMFFKKLDETTFALYILMELADMDWESQIKSRQLSKTLYTEKELIEMVKQITACLSFLQINEISHRDIKPNNILIFNDLSNNAKKTSSKSNDKFFDLIKVSDFGEARITQGNNTNKLYTIKGTELFMSPKLTESYINIQKEVNHNPYKSDCFSLGLCLIYAASLNINSVYDIRNEIQENNSISGSVNKYLKLKFTKKFIDMLIKMLNIDEAKRFDFNELNDFLKKY